jgi:hypothetical protein
MRPAKHSDGSDYYEYILLYTDDALVISDNAEQVLRNELGRYFTLKEKSLVRQRFILEDTYGRYSSTMESNAGLSAPLSTFNLPSRMLKNIYLNKMM